GPGTPGDRRLGERGWPDAMRLYDDNVADYYSVVAVLRGTLCCARSAPCARPWAARSMPPAGTWPRAAHAATLGVDETGVCRLAGHAHLVRAPGGGAAQHG